MGSLFPAGMSNIFTGHKECLCAALLNSLPNWIEKDIFLCRISTGNTYKILYLLLSWDASRGRFHKD